MDVLLPSHTEKLEVALFGRSHLGANFNLLGYASVPLFQHFAPLAQLERGPWSWRGGS